MAGESSFDQEVATEAYRRLADMLIKEEATKRGKSGAKTRAAKRLGVELSLLSNIVGATKKKVGPELVRRAVNGAHVMPRYFEVRGLEPAAYLRPHTESDASLKALLADSRRLLRNVGEGHTPTEDEALAFIRAAKTCRLLAAIDARSDEDRRMAISGAIGLAATIADEVGSL